METASVAGRQQRVNSQMPDEGNLSIRVMVVDEHRVARTGLVAYFDLIDDITVVGVAADGRQAVDCLAQLETSSGWHSASYLKNPSSSALTSSAWVQHKPWGAPSIGTYSLPGMSS